MIQNTFCHIRGVGLKTEANLWNKGVHNWSDWPKENGIRLPKQSLLEIPDIFETSLNALKNNDANFFYERLPASECWRLFTHFRNQLGYLDIETTGLGISAEITSIALYDGQQVSTYVNGRNLDQFAEDIQQFSVLVTYNGKSFDIPCIEKFFNITLPQAQIDLRYVLARLGYKGGLKGCEKQIGINRGALDGVDGSFAIHLWQLYNLYNNERALETLIAYNVEDTINLEQLLVHAWNKNIATTPFADEFALNCPEPPQLTYQPDLDCVAEVKQKLATSNNRIW